MPPARTVAGLVRDLTDRLGQAGIENARREAEVLVSAALDQAREWVLLHPDDRPSPELRRRLDALAQRRTQREPLAYVLGQVEFYSLPFRLSPDVMVPRPETEILAEAAIARARAVGPAWIVDVGTGSGVLAVVLARHLREARVAATDISLGALRVAGENAVRHQVADRVQTVCADLLSGFRRPVRAVIANLPYIRRDEFDDLQPEVRDYEPRLALNGGGDGLGMIRRLSGQLAEHVSPGGFAALEVGAGQARHVANLLAGQGFGDIEILPDYAGVERVVIGWRQRRG